jgi:hypothetical protein
MRFELLTGMFEECARFFRSFVGYLELVRRKVPVQVDHGDPVRPHGVAAVLQMQISFGTQHFWRHSGFLYTGRRSYGGGCFAKLPERWRVIHPALVALLGLTAGPAARVAAIVRRPQLLGWAALEPRRRGCRRTAQPSISLESLRHPTPFRVGLSEQQLVSGSSVGRSRQYQSIAPRNRAYCPRQESPISCCGLVGIPAFQRHDDNSSCLRCALLFAALGCGCFAAALRQKEAIKTRLSGSTVGSSFPWYGIRIAQKWQRTVMLCDERHGQPRKAGEEFFHRVERATQYSSPPAHLE